MPTPAFLVITTIEETLEKVAVVILAYGLTTHLRGHVGAPTIAFADASVSDQAPIADRPTARDPGLSTPA